MRKTVFAGLIMGFMAVTAVQAQDGWSLIKQNENMKAREAFMETLRTDSLNLPALKGMIYLCNADHNDYDLKKYTARMVKQVKDPHYLYLFDADDINSSDKNIPDRYLVDKRLSEADDMFFDRKFSEAKNVYANNVSILSWSYIGPFQNINGYGYEIAYPMELNGFEYDLQKTYRNYNRIDLRWVAPSATNYKGYLDFKEHCPDEADGVYYANTFFELPSDQVIQMHMARQYPVKIWIDDQLVFSNREKISFSRDAETAEFSLKSGWHRVLVKYCIGSFFTGRDGGDMYGYGASRGDYSYENTLSALSSILKGRSFGGMQESISFRITGGDGKLMTGLLSTTDKKTYTANPITARITDKEEQAYFKGLIDANPDDWFNYYLYFKAAIKGGYSEQVEEFALNTWKQNSDRVFFKIITEEIFNENGKKEKADKIISGIDLQKNPVFKLMYEKLREIDEDNDPDLYLDALAGIRAVSPGNLPMMRRTLDFYDKQGRIEDRKTLARSLIKQYPRYEFQLKEYLEDDNKPKDYDIGNREDYSTKKEEKEAAKSIRKYYSMYDYETLIKKYKGLNKPANALALYDEILKIEPDNFEKREEKAEYLFNLERHEEALKELETILVSQPYNSDIYELMGDIYRDKNDMVQALEKYKTAKQYSNGSGGVSLFGFAIGRDGSLDEKIEKIQGQKLHKSKFNSPSLDEMIANESDLDKYEQEESVVLGFVYDVMFERDGSANLFSKMAIKVLTDAGAKSWTEYDFSFLGNLTTCKVLKANGSEFNPDKRGGYVVFKNLEPGDIIKLEGSLKWNVSTTRESELGRELVLVNFLSFHVPVRHSKVEYGIEQGARLNYILHNLDDNLSKRSADGFDFYKWEYSDVKKVAVEEAIVDAHDTYASLMVSTLDDWAPVVKWYQAKTYRKLESNYELKAVRDSIIKPGMKDEEKVIAIYNYITKEIKYSSTSLLQSNHIPKNTDLTISSRIGDCKDVASLMIALLQMEGIESYYCLVKTNQFFHLKTLPSLLFDHVIAAYKLNGKMNYVDLTTDYYPYYVLNENDVNAWGLLIKEGETQLFQLPSDQLDPEKNLTVHEVKAQLNKDKSVEIKVNSTFNGMSGGMLRELHELKSRDNFEQEVLYYLGDGQYDNLDLETYNFNNMGEITEPLKGDFSFRAMNFSDNIVDIYFTRIPFMQGMKTTNIFSSSKRFNTIDLSDIFRVTPSLQKITLDFPSGTTVRKMPANIELDNEFVKYYLRFTRTKTGIYVERYQQFKTNEVKAADFKKFRELYLKLLDYDRTKIGLIVN